MASTITGPYSAATQIAPRKLGDGPFDAAPGNHRHLGDSVLLPGIPGRFTNPTDLIVSSNTTLTQRINYYHDLTISGGFTLTGIAGGTIIVVEHRLTVDGTISVNALGAGASGFGWGSGPWGRSLTTTTRTAGSFLSTGTIAANNPYAIPPRMQLHMPSGGSSVKDDGTGGSAGGAWPLTNGSVFDNIAQAPVDWLLFSHVMDLIWWGGGYTDATYGSIGGGAGGGGGYLSNVTDSTSAPGGVLGGAGSGAGDSSTGGGGGSGIGGGGGGGCGDDTGTALQLIGGAGGRGGGVLVILCRELAGVGTISANGAAGTAGTTAGGKPSGGGGGGGGGCVVVAYDTLVALPTLQANGGAAGAAGAAGARAGTAGGAGVATSFNIRTAG